jgi:tetratricopeptide (TPR) repeat protein
MKSLLLFFTLSLSVTTIITAQNCTLTEDAKRHYYRGRAAEKSVKTEADYKKAIDEYTKAFEYVPTCPYIAFDLGLCYEQYGKTDTSQWRRAIDYYNKYLELKPEAVDKEQVKGKIYQIEFALEQSK